MICNKTPRKYQKEDTDFLFNHKRSADWSDVGTGKSLKSYLYILRHLEQGRKVMVLMPPPLLGQYIHEFNRIFQDHGYTQSTYNIPLLKRKKLFTKKKTDIVFMSYQMFVKYYSKLGTYSVVVCDEAAALKSSDTKLYRFMQAHLQRTDGHFLEMSATPLKIGMVDAYGHINLRDPGAYRDFSAFERRHISYALVRRFKKIVGYRNKEELIGHLNRNSVRRLSDKVLDLKKPNVIEHHVIISDEHRNLYKKFLRERILEMGDLLIVALNQQALRQHALQLVTQVERYSKEGIDEDIPLSNLKSIVESIDTGTTKVLVFCQYRETVKKLDRLFEGMNPALIYGGSVTSKHADKFLNDDSCRICFAHYRSGGSGFNFQSVSHNVIMFEPVGVPADMVQAIGRVHRSGQEHAVNVWIFNYAQTLFSRLVDSALERDKDIKELMLDEKTILEALYIHD